MVTNSIDPILQLRFTQTIDGQPVATAFEDVVDPSTGVVFQQSPTASYEELDAAVAAARAAQPDWAALTWDAREALLGRLADAIDAEIAYLSTLLTMEQGATIAFSTHSIAGTAASLRTLGKVRVPARVIEESSTRIVTERWSPLGVMGAIAPWNAPTLLGMQKVATALIGGNTVVLKPSELTPLATMEIGRLSRGILPPGVLNVIGGGGKVGQALVAHAGLDKISFTGSTATGLAIARQSSEFLRSATLELGGNDAAILLPDGSIPDLVAAIVRIGLANRGQFCAAIKRVYVPRPLIDQVSKAVVAAARTIRIGSGLDPDVQMGPIQNKAQFEKICAFVDEARAAGGNILLGGVPLDRDGFFYPPTVVTGLSDGARLVDDEQFGPVVPIVAYDDLDIVIRNINAGPYGLTGSVWTANLDRGAEIASRLAVGTGWVNQHGAFDVTMPFPLIKASGTGIDYADYGVKGAMRMQVIHTLKSAVSSEGRPA
jgi:acyl-CoA reductase-like NAD-dependent aldehyde dehydrogenase